MSADRTTHTFWKLIESCNVIVPKLQRDYAQGREHDPAIEQIRNSLIDEIYSSVTENKALVLNFIYGEKDDDKFVPVDGQQRLTTLFLLHWYVFEKSGFTDGLERLKGFSYETRDTSRRFCENICDLAIDFSKETVSEQIEECYWFTGNFAMDPTIKSMLVVMDTLHNRFRNVEDIDSVKKVLTDDDCPISFLWLEMPNFQQTSDLYIKMNARGKLLSDFEIFKAKLQNSYILDRLLGENSDEKDRILFISKYNNEYAEFFYKLFQSEYDNALMGFIKEMIRDSYLSYVSRSGVSQKTYRSDYGKIKAMNGSVLFRYIENGGTGYEQCKNPESAFVNALKRVDKLLGDFNSMTNPLEFENTLQKEYYKEKDLFIRNHSKENLEEDVVRYSLYSFLYKFGIPSTYDQKNAYSMWRRIVYNIVTNSAFESRREDICEAFVFIEGIINKINSYDEASILNTLSAVKADSCTAAIRYQMREEIIKAELIKDASWKKEILEAELYFKDGEIGFILDYSKSDDGSYDIDTFRNYFECLRKIFDGEKRIKAEINASAFEQALLCMKDETNNATGHLLKQPNSTTSWGFVGKSYKELLKNITLPSKKKILKNLIDAIMASTKDINETIEDIISNVNEASFTDKLKWKIPFIRNMLFDVYMGDFKFRNCINLDHNNSEILMIAGTTVRSKSMELNTFLLYQELRNRKIASKLMLYATGVIKDTDGFPTRYIEVKDACIGYDALDAQKPYVFKQAGTVERLTRDDVLMRAAAL